MNLYVSIGVCRDGSDGRSCANQQRFLTTRLEGIIEYISLEERMIANTIIEENVGKLCMAHGNHQKLRKHASSYASFSTDGPSHGFPHYGSERCDVAKGIDP